MLPPSTVLAVYGLITQQDIGKLFQAGILPGLLAMAMYMITIAIICRVKPEPAADRAEGVVGRPPGRPQATSGRRCCCSCS